MRKRKKQLACLTIDLAAKHQLGLLQYQLTAAANPVSATKFIGDPQLPDRRPKLRPPLANTLSLLPALPRIPRYRIGKDNTLIVLRFHYSRLI